MDIIDVQKEVARLASQIEAPESMLPSYSVTEGFFIIVENGKYHYGYRERGSEHMHRATSDLDELLYWVFIDVTQGMAMRSKRIHRILSRNRREGYKKQLVMALGLLGKLDRNWRALRRPYVLKQIREIPY